VKALNSVEIENIYRKRIDSETPRMVNQEQKKISEERIKKANEYAKKMREKQVYKLVNL
jgi:hypothetical protein